MHAANTASPARLIDLLIPERTPDPAAADDRAAAARMLWEPFIEVAQACPERPAVIGAHYSISYDRLLTSALGLAQTLMRVGVGQGAPVAVFMRKSWEQVAAILGVQLAGAAYLPVPTDWPGLRIADLIQGTGSRVAVVDGEDAVRSLPEGVTIVQFDAAGPPAALEDVTHGRDPGDLAYIIPTSGTTGKPKAVMVEHGAAWNTIQAINGAFGMCEHDRVLGLSALHFDLSVYDAFGALAAGGAVVLPDAARTRDPEHWIDLCRSAEVTIWNSVPALARMLVEGGMPRDEALAQCPSLRVMMLSGDWIPLNLAQRVRQQRPDIELVSLGGATEAAIWSISHPIGEVDPSWKSIPYGRALPGQSIAVLDESLESLPPWAEGEIYIGGAGLARGYWRDEGLTRERFVRHPRTGERLYRTGDAGRAWPDGTVELLGRVDSQVKISGHRVELAEVEAHVESLPGIRSAVVSYRPVGSSGRKELVAYVVLADAPKRSLEPIADPIERLRFKLQQPGLRRFAEAVRPVTLDLAARDTLAAAFRARRTHRAFSTSQVPRESLNTLLSHLVQLELDGFALPKYLYPSAGSLYPVQIYLHARPGRVEGVEGGSYYHDPGSHRLYPLTAGSDLPVSSFGGVNLRVAEQAAFSIFLVGELAAIAPMYPEQARDFCLLEAGYIGQVLMTAAAGAGVGLCPIGGVEGREWRTLLQLEDSQVFLHAFLGGVPADGDRTDRIEGDLGGTLSADELQRALEGAAPPSRRGAEATALGELRELLASRLPSHMIPSVCVVLDALPLTENGKVDRNNLPEPGGADTYETPDSQLTPTEAKLMAMWRALLGDRVTTIDQGFFEAGGESLLLLELQQGLRDEFAVDVPLAHLFQYPSIRSLAGWLDQETGQDDDFAGSAND
ncbi:MAG: amino acid adenylation domain-containing protein [Vicinamibacterales bacterium]